MKTLLLIISLGFSFSAMAATSGFHKESNKSEISKQLDSVVKANRGKPKRPKHPNPDVLK
ncbi:MAG: hypothetical protein VX583_04180 [Bdellovibrionota bacterium]|tara:strand:- start:155 stop:334 length:180 start_codon:yes stop_codon:yes gene_type:complete